jgi:zinc transport system substrate-binding protein
MKVIQLVFLIVPFLLSGCRERHNQIIEVVASNSWTAAYAEAAGAKNVLVLAPFEMEHPAEYELRPGDIPNISKAKLIIYSGYENMVNRLQKGLDIPKDKLLQIETNYHFETIEKSVLEIAKRLGTDEIAKTNLKEIKRLLVKSKVIIAEKGLDKRPILVHYFQKPLALELGIQPASIFGPAPLEAKEIVKFAKSDAVLILDNFHNPVGQPLKEVLPNSDYRLLLNFPGTKQTRTLLDVIRYNVDQIVGE